MSNKVMKFLLWVSLWSVILLFMACSEGDSLSETHITAISEPDDVVDEDSLVHDSIDEIEIADGIIYMSRSYENRSSSSLNIVILPKSSSSKTNSSDSKITATSSDAEPPESSADASSSSQERTVTFWEPENSEALSEYDSVANTLTDLRDGQVYKTVTINNAQNGYSAVWMAENLNYAYLQPTETEDSSSFCYRGLASNCDKYGRLYMWSAAIDSMSHFSNDCMGCGYGTMKIWFFEKTSRGVCPAGWHIPDSTDFALLKIMDPIRDNPTMSNGFFNEDFVDGDSPMLAGYKGDKGYFRQGEYAYFWTSYEYEVFFGGVYFFELDARFVYEGRYDKSIAFSVRCIKDK